MIDWLKNMISPTQPDSEDQCAPVGVYVRPIEDRHNQDNIEVEISLNATVPGGLESNQEDSNALVPDQCADDDSEAEPMLEILDESSPKKVKATGIDPYETGMFDHSDLWNSPSRR